MTQITIILLHTYIQKVTSISKMGWQRQLICTYCDPDTNLLLCPHSSSLHPCSIKSFYTVGLQFFIIFSFLLVSSCQLLGTMSSLENRTQQPNVSTLYNVLTILCLCASCKLILYFSCLIIWADLRHKQYQQYQDSHSVIEILIFN